MDFERIDINQCPKGEGNKGPNRFTNTARCKTESTEVRRRSKWRWLINWILRFWHFSVNRWMVGDSGGVATNVDVNRSIGCPEWCGSPSWAKYSNERVMNSITMDLTALRLDVSSLTLGKRRFDFNNWIICRDSKGSNSMGKGTALYSWKVSRPSSRVQELYNWCWIASHWQDKRWSSSKLHSGSFRANMSRVSCTNYSELLLIHQIIFFQLSWTRFDHSRWHCIWST